MGSRGLKSFILVDNPAHRIIPALTIGLSISAGFLDSIKLYYCIMAVLGMKKLRVEDAVGPQVDPLKMEFAQSHAHSLCSEPNAFFIQD
jgi:hypothetical protein